MKQEEKEEEEEEGGEAGSPAPPIYTVLTPDASTATVPEAPDRYTAPVPALVTVTAGRVPAITTVPVLCMQLKSGQQPCPLKMQAQRLPSRSRLAAGVQLK